MRLIDADAFTEQISAAVLKKGTGEAAELGINIIKLVDAQPTAYDLEKVVQELEEEVREYERLERGSNLGGYHQEVIEYEAKTEAFKDAIEIVRNGGKE